MEESLDLGIIVTPGNSSSTGAVGGTSSGESVPMQKANPVPPAPHATTRTSVVYEIPIEQVVDRAANSDGRREEDTFDGNS